MCQARKVRCSGGLPCAMCTKRNERCEYKPDKRTKRRAEQKQQQQQQQQQLARPSSEVEARRIGAVSPEPAVTVPPAHAAFLSLYWRHVHPTVPFMAEDDVRRYAEHLRAGRPLGALGEGDRTQLFGMLALGAHLAGCHSDGGQYFLLLKHGCSEHFDDPTEKSVCGFLLLAAYITATGVSRGAGVSVYVNTAIHLCTRVANAAAGGGGGGGGLRPETAMVLNFVRLFDLGFRSADEAARVPRVDIAINRTLNKDTAVELRPGEDPERPNDDSPFLHTVNQALTSISFSTAFGERHAPPEANTYSRALEGTPNDAASSHSSAAPLGLPAAAPPFPAVPAVDVRGRPSTAEAELRKVDRVLALLRNGRQRCTERYRARHAQWNPALETVLRERFDPYSERSALAQAACEDEPAQLSAAAEATTRLVILAVLEATVLSKAGRAAEALAAAAAGIRAVTNHPALTLHDDPRAPAPERADQPPRLALLRACPFATHMLTRLAQLHRAGRRRWELAATGIVLERLTGTWALGGGGAAVQALVDEARAAAPFLAPPVVRSGAFGAAPALSSAAVRRWAASPEYKAATALRTDADAVPPRGSPLTPSAFLRDPSPADAPPARTPSASPPSWEAVLAAVTASEAAEPLLPPQPAPSPTSPPPPVDA